MLHQIDGQFGNHKGPACGHEGDNQLPETAIAPYREDHGEDCGQNHDLIRGFEHDADAANQEAGHDREPAGPDLLHMERFGHHRGPRDGDEEAHGVRVYECGEHQQRHTGRHQHGERAMAHRIKPQMGAETPEHRHQSGDRERADDLEGEDVLRAEQGEHQQIPEHRSALERIVREVRVCARDAPVYACRLSAAVRAEIRAELVQVSLEKGIGGIHQASGIRISVGGQTQ